MLKPTCQGTCSFVLYIWPRASLEGPLWNIKVHSVLVFAIYQYIYVEYRVEYEAQNCYKQAYIYGEYRVEYRIH